MYYHVLTDLPECFRFFRVLFKYFRNSRLNFSKQRHRRWFKFCVVITCGKIRGFRTNYKLIWEYPWHILRITKFINQMKTVSIQFLCLVHFFFAFIASSMLGRTSPSKHSLSLRVLHHSKEIIYNKNIELCQHASICKNVIQFCGIGSLISIPPLEDIKVWKSS